MSNRNLPDGNHRHRWADFPENVRDSTTHKLMGLTPCYRNSFTFLTSSTVPLFLHLSLIFFTISSVNFTRLCLCPSFPSSPMATYDSRNMRTYPNCRFWDAVRMYDKCMWMDKIMSFFSSWTVGRIYLLDLQKFIRYRSDAHEYDDYNSKSRAF
jgi:hypothetical protein